MPPSLTTAQFQIISIITRVSAVLGLIGALAIFYKRKTSPQFFFNPMGMLMLALAVSDSVNSLVGFIGRYPIDYNDEAFCLVEAVLMYQANVSSALLALGLAFNIYFVIVMNGDTYQVRKYQLSFIAFSFIFPPIVASIPIIINVPFYGNTDLWCWISGKDPINILYFFYMELWSVILLIIIAYFIVWRQLNKEKSATTRPNYYKQMVMRLMMAYSLTIVLSWIPGTINRVNDTTLLLPRFPLVLLQGLIAPARGLLNSFAFFYTIGKSPKDIRDNQDILTDPNFVIPRKPSYTITTSISEQDRPKSTANQKSNGHSDGKPISSLNNWISSLTQTSAPKLVPTDTFEAYLLKLNASESVINEADDSASMISKKNARVEDGYKSNRNSAESLKIEPI